MDAQEEVEALRRALSDKDAEMERLLYRVSHDLQEPLRKISAFSQLLRRDLGDDLPARAAEDLSYVLDASSRMQAMLEGLLVLSRVGRRELVMASLQTRACAEQALLSAGVGEIATRWEALPALRMDRDLLIDCYRRGLENALRYADPNEALRLTFTAEERGDAWVLGVSDNGRGVPDADAERIFEPFVRLHPRAVPGAGMGLAIVARRVEQIGGRAWVEPSEGGGAHLRFTMPKAGGPR